ncbi:AAA family ATPase [Candidatus Micrarchaeota archaeon]|nr:AAA family ATPase [Candidatus Micrarchaeota archaeon]
MEKLFSQNMQQSRIFKNQGVLLPEFTPTVLLHRENELREVAASLKPALKNLKPQNMLLFGPTGTGKTSSVKLVFSELKEYSNKIQCIYLNCWGYPTKQAVLSHIAEQLKETLPRRGLADDEIFHRIIERLKFEKKIAIIALDEIDRLMHKNEVDVLYDLSRADENHRQIFAIIGITNSPEIYHSLDDRIKSSLGFRDLEFRQYSPQQLKDILKERARESLIAGSYSEEVIALCAAHGAKHKGDARVAIETLLQSALKADSADKSKIEISDVRDVIDKTSGASLMKNTAFMGENELLLLEILKEAKKRGNDLTSGEIYEKFNDQKRKQKKEAVSERSILSYLQLFEASRLISTELSTNTKSGLGKTRIIKLIK